MSSFYWYMIFFVAMQYVFYFITSVYPYFENKEQTKDIRFCFLLKRRLLISYFFVLSYGFIVFLSTLSILHWHLNWISVCMIGISVLFYFSIHLSLFECTGCSVQCNYIGMPSNGIIWNIKENPIRKSYKLNNNKIRNFFPFAHCIHLFTGIN